MQTHSSSMVPKQSEARALDLSAIRKLTKHRLDCFRRSEQEARSKITTLSSPLSSVHRREVSTISRALNNQLSQARTIEDSNLREEAERTIHTRFSQIVQRLIAGQRWRAQLLEEGLLPESPSPITPNYSLLPTTFDPTKVSASTKGLRVYDVVSPITPSFSEGYLLLSQFFPLDEIASSVSRMSYLKTASKGLILTKNDGPAYIRAVFFIVVDETGELTGEKGKVIAAADGSFLANKTTTAFHLEHIASLPEYRRSSVATLLEIAIATRCNEYAKDAERQLGVVYPTNNPGTKLQLMILETEFPSLRQTEIKQTFGRIVFHSKNGFSIIDPLEFPYRQPDQNWDSTMSFSPEQWGSVPLFLAVRPFTSVVSATVLTDSLRLLFDSYVLLGASKQGVDYDFANTIRNLSSRTPRVIPLPQTPEELKLFIESTGYTSKLLASAYPDACYTKEYLSGGEADLPIEDAIRYFISSK